MRRGGVAVGLAVLTFLSVSGSAGAAVSDTAYVATTGAVWSIDTTSNTATAQIAANVTGEVAITPDGTTAYVANWSSPGTVFVIDTATDTVKATIPVPKHPYGVAVAPDGATAYVTHGSFPGSVTVISTATNTVASTIPAGDDTRGVAVAPDGQTVYVTNNTFSGSVNVIDTASNMVTATIPVGSFPVGLALTPDGTTAYVPNRGSGTVSVIDTVSSTVAATIAVGGEPFNVAVTPDGGHAYVTNFSGSVSVIDTASDTLATTIAVGGQPWDVAVTPDGNHAYVTNGDSLFPLSVIDTAASTVTSTIAVDGSLGVAVSPEQAPVAAFSYGPGPAGSASAFDASASSDPDGSVVSYRWDFGDGTTLTTASATTSHTYSATGSYTVSLTVTDDAGCSTVRVFTGQTVGCNGSSAATASQQVEVSAPGGGCAEGQSGLVISNDLASGSAQTGSPGQSGSWSFTVDVQNCTGGALGSVKLQGGTVSWLTGATAATDPVAGNVSIKANAKNRGQVVSWSGFGLAEGETASITVTVAGRVPKGSACGSRLPLSGVWKGSAKDEAGSEVSSGPSTIASIEVTCGGAGAG